MRHRVKKVAQLGRQPDHRQLLLRNLATSLVLHGKIQTTAAKATAVQPLIERLIARVVRGKEPREVIRYLKTVLLTEQAQKKAFPEFAKRYAERKGGYTRITPIGARAGDNAPKVQLELI